MQYSMTAARAALSAALLLVLPMIAPSTARAVTAPQASKAAALEGELEVLVEDYANGHSRERHFLKTKQGRVELKFNRKPTTLPSGTRVRVRGQIQDNVLALDGAQTGSVETVAAASSNTMGEQKVAVILVNFQDDASQPITAASARSLVFSTVDAFYRENSFQQAWFGGDVYGWFNIPVSKTTCNTELISQQADQAAAAAGVDLSGYGRKVYMFPPNACTWTGLATLGGSPTRAWINGVFNLRVVGHEIGHTFGLSHARGLDCDTSALGSTCTTLTYGDGADIMGNRAVHFNAAEKEKLGWLNDGVSPPIVTVTGSGRYTIEPYSSSSVGAKAIRVSRGPDPVSGKPRWYYIEYRQPLGADSIIANVGTLTKGVLVRAVTEDGSGTTLLDMTPNSITTSGFSDLEDGALTVGRSYTDSTAGVTVTLAAADTSGATLDVSFGGTPAPTCTRAAPALAISGSTATLAAGATTTYTVSLTNKDSSACAATTFTLARSLPTGWTGVLASNSLSLSPGATGTTTLSVTSPLTASAGSYGIGVGASSSVGSAHTANVSTTYSIAASTTTLTETVGTNKSSYLRGETVSMSALVRSNGTPVAGATVKLTVSVPGGASVVVNATSGSDGYARSTYKIGKGKAALGSYSVRADASSNGASATASTGFTVE